MAEEATDVAPEITPEAFDGEQETPKADPSPAKETEAKAEVEEPEAVKSEEAKAEPEKETEGEVEKPAEETPPTKADERKAQLSREIRDLNAERLDLVAQRNALRTEVEKANAEVYQPATEDELVDQINPATGEQYTRAEAKVDALDQRLQVRDYNDRVAEAQLTISSEAERVLRDFPIFNSDNPEFDKELAQEASQLLEANLVLDPNTGQVIGSNVSPYQLYKTLARASGISGVKGQLKGQQSTEQMLANADTNSSAAPPKKATDPVLALWQEED